MTEPGNGRRSRRIPSFTSSVYITATAEQLWRRGLPNPERDAAMVLDTSVGVRQVGTPWSIDGGRDAFRRRHCARG